MVKVPELKSQHIWIVVLIALVIPAIFPLGVPIQSSAATENIYNFIESLPRGSIVVMGGSGNFAFDLESSAGMIAAIKQMARRGLRLVGTPFGVEAVPLQKYCVDAARVDQKYGGPWKYGVDYVQLPYLPGGAAAYVSFLKDVWATVYTDVQGTPLSAIPLMKDFHSYKDIALWLCPHYDFPNAVRYATQERGIPSVYFAQAAVYSTYAPYMVQFPGKVWMTNGFLGGAQYEKLVGMSGLGTSAIDAYALVSVVFIGFVVLGNTVLLQKVGKEEEEKI